VRESVTMNTGTEDGGGITRVGDRCFLMVACHIAHDCQIGNDVTFADLVTLGGHVSIGDNTVMGGLAATHQFVRIGEGAMVGGMAPVRTDVIPFGLARSENLIGLNIVGLRRRGVTRAELHRLRRAYRALFLGEAVFADRIDAVATEFKGDLLVGKIIAFIRAGSKRGLMQPRGRRGGGEHVDDAD